MSNEVGSIDGLVKLLSNRYWRLNNLYQIVNKEGKVVPFRMNATQEYFYKNLHQLSCILKARQLGMSTFISLFLLDICLFNPNQSCGIIDKTIDDAKEKLEKIRFAWEHLEKNPNGAIADIGRLLKESIFAQADSALELQFSNKSGVKCGVSLRGGTFQYLHISEFGYVCNSNPIKAKEIMSGAINTVASGQFIFIESTFEGGKNGYFYDICRSAMMKEPESELEFKFYFFPWHLDKSYKIESDVGLDEESNTYFKKLKEEHGLEINLGAKLWYQKKRNVLGDLIYQQYPSTPAECWQSSIEGTIYLERILELYRNNRVIDFEYERELPVYTYWDIGFSDTTAIWAVQFARNEIYLIDYYEGEQEPCHHYAKVVNGWYVSGYNIVTHHLPHDASYTEKGSGKNYVSQLQENGIKGSIKVLPRTKDVWIGINKLRGLMPRIWVHKTKCKRGLDCLEAYRKKYNEKLGCYEQPLHDWASNGADAARYIAESMLYERVDAMVPQRRIRRINQFAGIRAL